MLSALTLALLSAAPPPLVFMTDFGQADDSVAICKGVMWSIKDDLRVVDLSHDVEPYSILDGARFLAGASPYYPAGTVFVAVIDPGVGSERRAVAAKSKKGQYFVVPDNGLLTLVARQDGLEEVRVIENAAFTLPGARSATFHGRDVFAPAGAHLAAGKPFAEIGPAVPDLVKLDIPRALAVSPKKLEGAVIAIERPYGNLVTNLDGPLLANTPLEIGRTYIVQIEGKKHSMPFARTFSDVPKGKALLYRDSRGRLGVALNQGNFAEANKISVPARMTLTLP